jgi:hypothetical protein
MGLLRVYAKQQNIRSVACCFDFPPATILDGSDTRATLKQRTDTLSDSAVIGGSGSVEGRHIMHRHRHIHT